MSDRFGFNNPDTEWDGDEIEYIVIGDSFAHGACVNRPNDISSILRNLTKKKVLIKPYFFLKSLIPSFLALIFSSSLRTKRPCICPP